MKDSKWAVLSGAVCLIVACSSKPGAGGDAGITQTATIGAPGGEVAFPGGKLKLPVGALATDTQITVTTSADAPSGYEAQSAVLSLAPAGLQFSAPVDLTLDFAGDAINLKVFHSKLNNTSAFDALTGTVSGNQITAQIDHFSVAFAGRVAAGTGDGGVPTWLFADYVEAYCHLQLVCGFYETVAGCIAQQGSNKALTLHFAQLDRRIAAGTAMVDAAAARACFDAVKAETRCVPEVSWGSFPQCTPFVSGTIAGGGPCYLGDECPATHFCQLPKFACPGTCEAYRQVGETVAKGQRCATGSQAYEGVCVTQGTVGTACARQKPCVLGAYCNGTVCATKKTAGTTCQGGNECGDNLYCGGPANSQGQKTCLAYLGTGEVCSNFTSLNCKRDLVCNALTYEENGTCVAPLATGGRCWSQTQCAPPAYCTSAGSRFPDGGTCAPLKPAGQPCNWFQCDDNTWCHDDAGVCSPRPTVGQPCSGGECDSISTCTRSDGGSFCKQVICLSP